MSTAPIKVLCKCGKRFRVKPSAAGRRVRCPDCKNVCEVRGIATHREQDESTEIWNNVDAPTLSDDLFDGTPAPSDQLPLTAAMPSKDFDGIYLAQRSDLLEEVPDREILSGNDIAKTQFGSSRTTIFVLRSFSVLIVLCWVVYTSRTAWTCFSILVLQDSEEIQRSVAKGGLYVWALASAGIGLAMSIVWGFSEVIRILDAIASKIGQVQSTSSG